MANEQMMVDTIPGPGPAKNVINKTTGTKTMPRFLEPKTGLRASLITCVTIVLRLALNPVLGSRNLGIVFVPVVLLISFFAGPGPGIVSTIICSFAMAYFWMEPIGSWRVT